MITEKAIYWMAVGLVALLAGNHFVSRFDGRCLGTRTMAAFERLSGGPAFAYIVDNTSAKCARAQTNMMRAQTRWAAAQTRFASTQTHFASLQNRMAREESLCARLEAEKAQREALEQLRQVQVHVIAPNQNFRVQIPEIAVPAVQVSVDGDNL